MDPRLSVKAELDPEGYMKIMRKNLEAITKGIEVKETEKEDER